MCRAPVERRHERFARRADATGRQSSRRAIRKQNDVRFGDILKILAWDGSGLCLFSKRLEQGRFVWPPIVDGRLQLTPAQLALLIEGIDWRRTVAPEPVTRPEAV